jgi:hypothetical protein
MNQKTKEELIKLATSKVKQIKRYKDALGFDDLQKFADAFGLTFPQRGRLIHCRVFYLFYYKWMKENKKEPLSIKQLANIAAKNKVRSKPYGRRPPAKPFKAYVVEGFPEYNWREVREADEVVKREKEKRRKKKNRSVKKVLQPENAG